MCIFWNGHVWYGNRSLLIMRWWSSALISVQCCGFLFQTRLVSDILYNCDILISYVIPTLLWHLKNLLRILFSHRILCFKKHKTKQYFASRSSIDVQIDIFVLLKCRVKYPLCHSWLRLLICECSFGIYSLLCSSTGICDKQI